MPREMDLPPNLGQKLCNALGLDSRRITKLTMTLARGGSHATIRTESVLVEGDDIATVLREYDLKPKGVSDDG